MIKQLLAAAAALVLAAPLAASAQEVPSYAEVQGDQQIHGRITAFDGAYNLQVRDDNGYVDNVELHDGTIINPTGLTLAPGMIVSILGDGAGAAFDANEIDTPYVFESAVPYYGGHPWNYYGPSISLGFFFGNTGWWHGSRETRVVVNDYTTNEPARVLRAPAERPFAPVPRAAVPLQRSVPPRAATGFARGTEHTAAPAERGSTAHERH
jgi:hypothetical protein